MRLQAIAILMAGACLTQPAMAQVPVMERAEAYFEKKFDALKALELGPKERSDKVCKWAKEAEAEADAIRKEAFDANLAAIQLAQDRAPIAQVSAAAELAGKRFELMRHHAELIGLLDGMCASIAADLQLKTNYGALVE